MSKYEQAIDYLQPIADNAELNGYSEALEVALSAMRDAERQRKERKNAREINCAALETYGKEAQKGKLFEEIGELMEALCKCDAGRDKVVHLAEEIADVGIMLEQMAILFDCEEEVERQRRYKLRRLEQRVEEAKSESNLRVNEPLTLEEMQNMMGKPVWIVDRHGNGNWEIVSKGILSIYNGYKAYRSKPDHFREVKKMVEVSGDG